MSWRVGTAKVDITYLKHGVGLLGWGDFNHKAYGIETRLFARAYVIEEKSTGKKIAWICNDICFVTQLLKQEVSYRLEEKYPELGLHHDNIILTATHTHSAPGGFSQSLVYNLPNESVVPEVFETYTAGVVDAVVKAHSRLRDSRLYFHESEFPAEVPVAFNRSHQAYNRNPDIPEKVTEKTRHLAIDRNMYTLRFDSSDSGPLGSIQWFGVHATTIKRSHEVISSDNKGKAAELMEESLRNRYELECVTAFPQTTAGDVSPNYKKHRGILETLGLFRDDFQNRDFSAKLQTEHALKLFEKAPTEGQEITRSQLDWHLWYVDMSQVSIDPEFCGGSKDERTGQGVFGTRFILGTQEGRGAPWWTAYLAAFLCWLRGRKDTKIHGKKYFLIETVTKRWLGFKNIAGLPVPAWIDPMLGLLKRQQKHPILDKEPLVPQIMPLQIVLLGNLAIVALPAEPTTVTGRRMKKLLGPILQEKGIDRILIQGYSNAYSGYITTREEYDLQRYEGSHTLYGKWTEAAYRTLLRPLAQDLLKNPDQRKPSPAPRPPRMKIEDLVLRKFSFYRWKLRTYARTRRRWRAALNRFPSDGTPRKPANGRKPPSSR